MSRRQNVPVSLIPNQNTQQGIKLEHHRETTITVNSNNIIPFEIVKGFNEINPDFAERVMVQFELDGAHDRQKENKFHEFKTLEENNRKELAANSEANRHKLALEIESNRNKEQNSKDNTEFIKVVFAIIFFLCFFGAGLYCFSLGHFLIGAGVMLGDVGVGIAYYLRKLITKEVKETKQIN